MKRIDRARLHRLYESERQLFGKQHPRSEALPTCAEVLAGGVPMNWMSKWAGPFPVFVASACGAHFTDVDGNDYDDLCLGNIGAMTGHSPEASANAIASSFSAE